jgi:transcriptional regulator with GAF, ATPase, and Fis domain
MVADAIFLGMPAIIRSPSMLRLIETVKRVAQSESAVLITGESGSGKEIIARAIHHYSLRHSKPWVDVNCSALPENLIESELFGNEKGAFSGADVARPGLFEVATSGSLFLDEIGELELKMQVKLLRVLDRVPFYRLGGRRKIEVDVRIIAATNRNLPEAVRTGQFRADLYHRLNQIQLRLPPLRERPEDVDGLARLFIHETNPDLRLSAPAASRLMEYPWPGNVRELRNVATRAALLAEGSELRPEDFDFTDETSPPARPFDGPVRGLQELERQAIFRALSETGGNQKGAAALLGISSRTLSRKLKIYGQAQAVGARS